MELVKKEQEPIYTIRFTEEELKQVIYSYIAADYEEIKQYAEDEGITIKNPNEYDYISADLKRYLIETNK